MEMSPKAIAAVTFPVVRKGYDPEQVRSFLSQLSRGVEELQNRALQSQRLETQFAYAPVPAEATR
jgi:DivIVA domain-containing protein